MKKMSSYAVFIGIIFIVIGFIFLIKPELALRTMIIITAIFALLKGLFDIASFFRTRKNERSNDYITLLTGILILIVGFLLFFNHYFGMIIVGVLFAIWFAIESISTLISLRFFTNKKSFGFWLLLLLSLAALAMSILLLIRPAFAALSFTLLIGLFFIFQGISVTIISLTFKSWFSNKE